MGALFCCLDCCRWGNDYPSRADRSRARNSSEDLKEVIKEGVLTKVGDYYRKRHFVLVPGQLRYYEYKVDLGMPLPKQEIPGVKHVISYPKSPGAMALTSVTPPISSTPRGVMLLSPDERTSGAPFEWFVRPSLTSSTLFYLSGISPDGQRVTWTLQAATARERESWILKLRIAARPAWAGNLPFCQICKSKFTCFKRRHHCRNCGALICQDCISCYEKIVVLGFGSPVPICRDCRPRKEGIEVGSKVSVYGKHTGYVMYAGVPPPGTRRRAQEVYGVRLDKSLGDNDGSPFFSCALGHGLYVPKVHVSRFSEQLVAATRIKKQQTEDGFSWENLAYILLLLLSAQTIDLPHHSHQALARQPSGSNLDWAAYGASMFYSAIRDVKVLPSAPYGSLSRSACILLSEPKREADRQLQYLREPIDFSDYHGSPIEFPLTVESVYAMIEQFRRGIWLHRNYVYRICCLAKDIFDREPTLLHLEIPPDSKLTILGDIHGQLGDLLTIFTLNGLPSPSNPYLFNGDYVDRGFHGVEVLMVIFAFKILYPEHVWVHRGNHECRSVNFMMGFAEELVRKYGERHYTVRGLEGGELRSPSPTPSASAPHDLFELFESVFDRLPLCSLVKGKVLVCHGGLFSKDGVTLSHISSIRRKREVPHSPNRFEEAIFEDLLWSDPKILQGTRPSTRGAGVEFGEDVTADFLKRNGLELIIRSHECVDNGWEVIHGGRVITLFSASLYCGVQNNKGAYLILNSDLQPDAHTFIAQPLQHTDVKGETAREKEQRIQGEIKAMLKVQLLGGIYSIYRHLRLADKETSGLLPCNLFYVSLCQALKLDIPYKIYLRDTVKEAGGLVDYRRFLATLKESAPGTPQELEQVLGPSAVKDIVQSMKSATKIGEQIQNFEANLAEREGSLTERQMLSTFEEVERRLRVGVSAPEGEEEKKKEEEEEKKAVEGEGFELVGHETGGLSPSASSQEEDVVLVTMDPAMRKRLLALVEHLRNKYGNLHLAYEITVRLGGPDRLRIELRALSPPLSSTEEDRLLQHFFGPRLKSPPRRHAFFQLLQEGEKSLNLVAELIELVPALPALSLVFAAKPSHIESIFERFDVEQSGSISLEQYLCAMMIIGQHLDEPLEAQEVEAILFLLDNLEEDRINYYELIVKVMRVTEAR